MCYILRRQVFAAGWKKIFPWKNVSWQKYFCWQKLVFSRWSYFCSWKPSQEHCSRKWLLLILHHVVSLNFKSSIGINDARSDATTNMNMLLKSRSEIRTVELLPVFSTVFFHCRGRDSFCRGRNPALRRPGVHGVLSMTSWYAVAEPVSACLLRCTWFSLWLYFTRVSR